MADPAHFNVETHFSCERWREIEGIGQLVEQATAATILRACEIEECTGRHEVAFNLSDDAEIKSLNHQFRGKDSPTNVLSFPFEDDLPEHINEARPFGDIILAFETISREAREQQKPLRHHIAHLCVHGILHLFGYDHIVAKEAEEMETLECEILATLHIPSPYTDSP